MQDFINSVVQQLGMNEGKAKAATGGLLDIIKDNVPGADFDDLLAKLPGASDLMKESSSLSAGSTSGMLGKLGGMLGGKAGTAMSVAGLLEQSGLSSDKFGDFGQLFMNFIKDKAGSGIVDKLLASVPELKKLLG